MYSLLLTWKPVMRPTQRFFISLRNEHRVQKKWHLRIKMGIL